MNNDNLNNKANIQGDSFIENQRLSAVDFFN